MIDLDDTITIDGYINIVNDFLKTNYTYEDIDGYWVDEIVPDNQMQEYLNYFYDKINLYEHVKWNTGAKEVIEKLTKYYEVLICSAYIDHRDIYDSVNLVVHKHHWLLDNLPFIKPENFIFTSHKEVINAEIKIDDKVQNLEGNAELKLLITAYHNKNITNEELKAKNIIRVNNWYEIEEILLKH